MDWQKIYEAATQERLNIARDKAKDADGREYAGYSRILIDNARFEAIIRMECLRLVGISSPDMAIEDAAKMAAFVLGKEKSP